MPTPDPLPKETTVQPDDLRIAWRPYPEPVRETFTNRAGEQYEVVYRGAVRIEWDAPNGRTVALMHTGKEDLGPDAYDQMRTVFAQDVQAAYKRLLEAEA